MRDLTVGWVIAAAEALGASTDASQGFPGELLRSGVTDIAN